METYKRNIASDYWALSDKIYSLQQALSNPKFKENVGDELYNLTQERLNAIKTEFEIVEKQVRALEPFGDNFLNVRHDRPDWGRDYINRDMVIEQVDKYCLREMYRKAQPSADYDEYERKLANGEITEEKGNEVYRRHYLSKDEFQYIVNKYIYAFRMGERWREHVDTVIEYLEDGAMSPRKDKDGFHPRLRHMKDEIKALLTDWVLTDELDALTNNIYDTIVERIGMCRDFYRFDSEEDSFRFRMALLYGSPTSNAEEVKKYWKSKGVNIEIVERDPEKFWENDYKEQNE